MSGTLGRTRAQAPIHLAEPALQAYSALLIPLLPGKELLPWGQRHHPTIMHFLWPRTEGLGHCQLPQCLFKESSWYSSGPDPWPC